MNFYQLLDRFRTDTLDVSVPAFAPELAICATIVVMLIARMPGFGRKLNSFFVALPGSLIALWLAAPWRHLQAGATDELVGRPIFDGLLIYGPKFFKNKDNGRRYTAEQICAMSS